MGKGQETGDVTTESLKMNLSELAALTELLKGANLRRYPQADIEEQLKKLTSVYRMVGIGRSSHQMVYRGRICSSADGFANLFDCIYPKAEKLKEFGRANYPGQPAFYGSWNWTTVFGELRAEPGQFIQIIAVRPRPGIDIAHYTVGEYEHITYSGASLINSQKNVAHVQQMIQELPEEEHFKTLVIDAFLADQFSRRAERLYEYKLTAAFANYIFGTKAGLMYPSIEVRGGINRAVSASMFDEQFEVLCTWVFELRDYWGYSVYDFRELKSSCEFETDGTILWDSKKKLSIGRRSLQGLTEVLGDVQPWRVPA